MTLNRILPDSPTALQKSIEAGHITLFPFRISSVLGDGTKLTACPSDLAPADLFLLTWWGAVRETPLLKLVRDDRYFHSWTPGATAGTAASRLVAVAAQLLKISEAVPVRYLELLITSGPTMLHQRVGRPPEEMFAELAGTNRDTLLLSDSKFGLSTDEIHLLLRHPQELKMLIDRLRRKEVAGYLKEQTTTKRQVSID